MTAASPLKSADLVKRDPALRQTRFYRLDIWPDLFGGFSLAREYGRIGQPGRLHLEPFAEIDAARKAFARIVSRKQRRRFPRTRSEEHTSELQSRRDLVCRHLLVKKILQHH